QRSRQRAWADLSPPRQEDDVDGGGEHEWKSRSGTSGWGLARGSSSWAHGRTHGGHCSAESASRPVGLCLSMMGLEASRAAAPLLEKRRPAARGGRPPGSGLGQPRGTNGFGRVLRCTPSARFNASAAAVLRLPAGSGAEG
ncbi:unnamed protein product, partial [Prorocentrum cordatum]